MFKTSPPTACSALLCLFTTILVLAHAHGEPGTKQSNKCNFFKGSWIMDRSYPIYNGSECPFVDLGLNCQKNGRIDNTYLNFRWQPHTCSLSRFNGERFLKMNRGKKIILCSLKEYGVSVMYLKNGFLVDLVVEKRARILKLDSISRFGKWKGADILVFNSYHWWTHTGTRQTDMRRMLAYKIALTTWAKWVDANIDFEKTRVFFQGVSAVHEKGLNWNEPSACNCKGQTLPIRGLHYPGKRC
ncbi:hypothetical protein L1987_55527 [Smallanthus sonchifolius]|uniref:Uncharacterized protein n=1 Tax=Smallanthus sonchifolius TaxID=185202 RepID=A0ACB9EAH5_9ASTR|nr:hypothetical protein L1987_55527 [Smallanthus sonchifolius]